MKKPTGRSTSLGKTWLRRVATMPWLITVDRYAPAASGPPSRSSGEALIRMRRYAMAGPEYGGGLLAGGDLTVLVWPPGPTAGQRAFE